MTGKGLLSFGRRPFAPLSVYNYRLYFIGQVISLSGTWLQTVAVTWLMLRLTHSGTQLGLVAAAQFLPILLFGAYGGLIADRFNKRRLLYATQTSALVLALILASLVATQTIQVWMVFVLAAALGFVQMVDSPARQTFLMEMVGRDKLTGAISLNSIEVNLARVLGPLAAGVLIASVGIAWCFMLNAVSFLAVLICLRLMRRHELHSRPPVPPARGQLRAGFRYIRRTAVLRNVLIMMALIGALAYEFQVVLPLFATKTFHAGAGGYAVMMAAMGGGALLGGLLIASRGAPSPKRLLGAALAFGLSLLLTAVMPDFGSALVALVVVGICSIGFTSLANATLQLNSSADMRGRVMSLWTVAFLGSTPIGGPIVGYLSQHGSPRLGLAVGGLAALAAGAFGAHAVHRHRRQQRHEAPAAAEVS